MNDAILGLAMLKEQGWRVEGEALGFRRQVRTALVHGYITPEGFAELCETFPRLLGQCTVLRPVVYEGGRGDD